MGKTNAISAEEYYAMNQAYLTKKEELEAKIKKELTENAENYPENAEKLYYGETGKELSEEDSLKLAQTISLLDDATKKDKKELENLLEDIVKYAGNVRMGRSSEKEQA